jgi:hypothetical protein
MIRSFLAAMIITLCSTVAFAQPGASLVNVTNATHVAVKDGSWQDPEVWSCGVPGDGSQVHIPEKIHVTNHGVTANVKWIHIDGTLDVCTHCNTEINAHTVYTDMTGKFHLGKPGMPVDGTAKLNFVSGPFLDGDWQQISLGHICHGEFLAAGVEKTPHTVIEDINLPKGSTKLKLINVPVKWKAGDKIAVAGTDSLVGEKWVVYQTEYLTITKITGKELEFTPPLQYRHYRWKPELVFHVVNLDKNVVIQSVGTGSRGHQMFMSPMNHMVDVLEMNLGRTDKSSNVTDPRIDPISLELVVGSDLNPRGRYMDHNHKVGPLNAPSTRKRVILRNSPGWGLVNHDSNCEWDDCVCTECFGAAFCTEEGQERGYMRNCLAFMNRGQGDYITSTDSDHGVSHIGDWGKDGAGFWLQGGLVEVSNCVSFDNSGRGFALFNRTLNGYPAIHATVPSHLRFPIIHKAELLSEEYFTLTHGDSPNVAASSVPQRVFHNNTAYGNRLGVQGWNAKGWNNSSQNTWPLSVRGNITNLTLWGRGNKLHFEYANRYNIRGIKIVGDSYLRGESAPFLSINAEQPIHLRGPEISIWGVQIEGMLNRNNWPEPKKIYTDTNNGADIDNFKIEGTYPTIPANLPQP